MGRKSWLRRSKTLYTSVLAVVETNLRTKTPTNFFPASYSAISYGVGLLCLKLYDIKTTRYQAARVRIAKEGKVDQAQINSLLADASELSNENVLMLAALGSYDAAKEHFVREIMRVEKKAYDAASEVRKNKSLVSEATGSGEKKSDDHISCLAGRERNPAMISSLAGRSWNKWISCGHAGICRYKVGELLLDYVLRRRRPPYQLLPVTTDHGEDRGGGDRTPGTPRPVLRISVGALGIFLFCGRDGYL